MVLVYLPTFFGDFERANVGIHIPAPWSIWVVIMIITIITIITNNNNNNSNNNNDNNDNKPFP